MMATVLVVSARPSGPARAVMANRLMPTPMSAVSSGSPAAASEPKVISSTTAATEMPIASAVPLGPPTSSRASPPASTVSPESRACSSDSSRWLRLASVRSAASTL